jgi:hypothetical protein
MQTYAMSSIEKYGIGSFLLNKDGWPMKLLPLSQLTTMGTEEARLEPW